MAELTFQIVVGGEASTQKAIEGLTKSVQSNIDKLQAQKAMLTDAGFQAAQAEAAKLKHEIEELTKAQHGENEAVQLTISSRRELMVMMHELSQFRYKNLAGSAMVLEEGEGGAMGAIKAATAMLGGPYVVAAGAAALATVGIGAAFWKASEAQAEMVHKSELLAQMLGVSGEAIRGFQYLVAGTNVTTEEMGRVFGIFEKNLGNNSEKFRELGITARDPMAALEQVMDKARGMGDAVERATFLNEALGRGWEKTAPVILKGGAAMREAVEVMKIPEDTLAAYERANNAQIEIDKNFTVMGKNAGGFFAEFRANVKEFEESLTTMIVGTSELREAARQESMYMAGTHPDVVNAEAGKAQADAIKAAHREMGKSDRKQEIENVREEWKGRLDAFREGYEKYKKTAYTIGSDPTGEYKKAYDNYKIVRDAQLQAEADVNKSFDKKDRNGQSRLPKNDPNGADSREFEVMSESARDHARNVERAQKAEEKKQEQFAKNLADINAAGYKQDEKNLKTEFDRKKKLEEEYLKWKREENQKVFDYMEGGLEQQILLMERGDFTAKELGNTLKAAAEEGIARLLAQTAISFVQAQITGAAWREPALMASIASFGSADAVGLAAFQSAQVAAGHAMGGTQFGGYAWRHESGPEMAHAVVPTQIYQASHTHSSTTNAPITIHIHGGDQKAILRTIRNATTNGAGVSH